MCSEEEASLKRVSFCFHSTLQGKVVVSVLSPLVDIRQFNSLTVNENPPQHVRLFVFDFTNVKAFFNDY